MTLNESNATDSCSDIADSADFVLDRLRYVKLNIVVSLTLQYNYIEQLIMKK